MNQKPSDSLIPAIFPNRERALQPCDELAERSLLGCILENGEALDRVSSIIDSEHFYRKAHGLIYLGMLELNHEGIPIDSVTIVNKLIANKVIMAVGGSFYITGLLHDASLLSSIEHHARIIQEKYNLRRIIKASYKTYGKAYEQSENSQELIASAEAELKEIYNVAEDYNLESEISETIESIYYPNLIKTGFSQIDRLTGGMTRGEITTIAGRTGHGKSMATINLVRNFCSQGLKVALFNREMMNRQVLQRLIILESNGAISYHSVCRLGIITDHDKEMIAAAKQKILDRYSKLYMFDHIKSIEGSINEVNKLNPDVIIDDYIQLVSVKGMDDRRLQMVQIMSSYKWAAKVNDAVVIVVSQLGREMDRRIDKRPRLSDLLESSSIETDSECVIFLYRDWLYNYDRSQDNGTVADPYELQFIVQKNRFGIPGVAKMGFAGDACQITESPSEAAVLSRKYS